MSDDNSLIDDLQDLFTNFDRLLRWLKDVGPNYLERCGGQPTAEGFIDYVEKAIRASRSSAPEVDAFFRALTGAGIGGSQAGETTPPCIGAG